MTAAPDIVTSRLLDRLRGSLRPRPDRSPLVAEAPPLTIRQVIGRFWPQLRPLRWWLLAVLAVMALAPLIEIVEILLFQRLVDDVLVPATLAPLVGLAAMYVGLNLVSALISGLDDLLSTWVSQRFLVDLRTRVFRHVLALPSAVHDRSRLGDVMSRLTSDAAAVESFMVGQLTTGIAALLRLVAFVAALFWLQWELAALSLVAVPLLWWVATRFARLTRVASRERRRRTGSLAAVTEESLGQAALVQDYNREASAIAAYHRQNLAIASAEMVASRVRAVFAPLADLAELVGLLAVVALGTWALATDRLTLGGLLAFLALMLQCYRPLRDLGDLIPSLYSATAGVERIVELLDTPAPVDPPDAPRPNAVRGRVGLNGVRVRHRGAFHDALRSLDLQVQRGELVALVGASGSGKSTVARLLTRHVEPTTGTITLDGHDVTTLAAGTVRDWVTVVHQEAPMLDATIADNIRFGRPDATDAEVAEAARVADADEFVRRLPEGYGTRVGQRGRTLSGGQRQRIAIARGVLRGTPVLVLDEPTAALDTGSSRRLMHNLLEVRDRCTVLVATHDPVVEAYVDRVVRLGADSADASLEVAPC